jgi:hypothetical protein
VRNCVEFGGCSLQPTRSDVLSDVPGRRSFTITMSCNRLSRVTNSVRRLSAF